MKKYYVLAILILVLYFVQSFFLSTGGIGADSLSYFGIAADLPQPETNLFPLGFPALLRLSYSLTEDYFWASKFLNFSLMAGMLLFSYLKEFYFRETVLLFTGKTMFFVYTNVMSESVFLLLLYFLIYFFHQRFQDKVSSRKFILWSSILMILMFVVRYSAVYVLAGILLFFILSILGNIKIRFKKDLLYFLLISGLGIFGLLMSNYFHFESFTGEDLRGKPSAKLPIDIFRNFLGATNVLDPFIGIKPSSNSLPSIGFQMLLMFVDFLLLYFMLKLFFKKKKNLDLNFHYLLWMIAGSYTLMLFISEFFQQIEELNMRMLAAANICLFISFLIIYFEDLKNDKGIFRSGCLLLLFLSVYNVKVPANYLKNKKEIEAQMPKFSEKKFIYNDEAAKVTKSEYKVPVINKTFKYSHTNQQIGGVKQNIAGTINPKIKWVKSDSLLNKKSVLYTSQLILSSETH